MPDPNLSAAIQEAYASAPDDAVIFHTLEIRHDSFEEPIRVVRDHVPLNATLEDDAPLNAGEEVTFLAYAFDFQLPPVKSNGVPELLITIDNISQEIEQALRSAAESAGKLEVTYRPYLSTDLSAPQMDPPITLTVLSATADTFRVTARCSFGDLVNKQYPDQDYTAARFPGLVR